MSKPLRDYDRILALIQASPYDHSIRTHADHSTELDVYGASPKSTDTCTRQPGVTFEFGADGVLADITLFH